MTTVEYAMLSTQDEQMRVITVSYFAHRRSDLRPISKVQERRGNKNPALLFLFVSFLFPSSNSRIPSPLPSFVPRDRSIFGLTCWIGEKAMERKGVGSLGHG